MPKACKRVTGILRNSVELCVVLVFMRETPANAGTERCGRCIASELATDAARPHSLQ